VHSGAVFYAAIAGVCLFISGLISGYYDNYAAYNRIPERILQLGWPRRLFGEERMRGWRPTSATTSARSPATCGSASCSAARRSSACSSDCRSTSAMSLSRRLFGIAFVGLDFTPDPWLFAWAVLGVATIGFMNLTVSFALALNVALRSRQVAESQWKILARSVLAHLRRQPRDFSCRRTCACRSCTYRCTCTCTYRRCSCPAEDGLAKAGRYGHCCRNRESAVCTHRVRGARCNAGEAKPRGPLSHGPVGGVLHCREGRFPGS
jgi:hypothetical protein